MNMICDDNGHDNNAGNGHGTTDNDDSIEYDQPNAEYINHNDNNRNDKVCANRYITNIQH